MNIISKTMKKIFFTFLLISVTIALSAQDYKTFKVGLRYGYNTPLGNTTGGLIQDLEPAIRINYYTIVFLRFERQYISQYSDYAKDAYVEGLSYSIGGQYYIREWGDLRMYAGLGFGQHYDAYSFNSSSSSSNTSNSESIDVESGFKFLIYPRIGFDYGHFNFLIDINLIGNSDGIKRTSIYNRNTRISTTTEENITISNSYLSFKLGVSLGGGKR